MPDQKPQSVNVNYPLLPPRFFGSVSSQQYIDERLNSAIKWYDKTADKTKKLYLNMRAATVIGGALVPVLVNVNLPYVNILTTILSLIVVLLVSLESVYHYREQWTNYRSTEQYLRNEYFLYTSKSGAYAALTNKETAYRHFVERVEGIIDAENSSTLKIMTSLTETKSDTKPPMPSVNSGADK